MKPDPEDIGTQSAAEETPPPQEPQTPQEPQEPQEPAQEGELDPEAPYGRKADGTPRAKPGRKSASAQTIDRLESVTPAPPRVTRPAPMAAPAPIAAVDYKALGETAATLWFSIPSVYLGEEWEPKDNEPRIVADAFARYFKASGTTDIPPGAALALVLISYTGSRMTKPTIKTRMFGAFEWIKSKLPSRR